MYDKYYGVVYMNGQLKVFKSSSYDILMKNGCEALFVSEKSAKTYANEQGPLRHLWVDNTPALEFCKMI